MTKPKPFALAVAAVLLLAGLVPAAAQDKPGRTSRRPPRRPPPPARSGSRTSWPGSRSARRSSPRTAAGSCTRSSPVEGESEIVLRQTAGAKEHRFPIGEAPRSGSSVRPGFSADSKWAAFLVYPGSKETSVTAEGPEEDRDDGRPGRAGHGRKDGVRKGPRRRLLRREPRLRRPPPLRSREPGEGEGQMDRFRPPPARARDGKGSQHRQRRRVRLRQDGRTAGPRSSTPRGRPATASSSATWPRATVVSLDNDKAAYKTLAWTEKGEALAVLKGKEDKAYEDKLWSVLAFDGFGGPKGPRKIVYDPAADKSFPEGMTVSPNRSPEWTEGFDAILFGIQEAKKKKDADKKDADEAKTGGRRRPARAKPDEVADEDMPDLVIWHGQDSRLQSQQQVQEQPGQELQLRRRIPGRPRRSSSGWPTTTSVTSTSAPKGRFAVGQDDRAYELDANLDGRSFQDIYVDRHEDRRADPGPDEEPLVFRAALRRHPFPLLRRRPFLHLRHGHGQVRQHHQGRPGLVRQRGQRHTTSSSRPTTRSARPRTA
ncbi:MAG: hypothetical protein M0C28_45340 [Candidatus Moduliflexus flocculans]|nr:hypothetical protein [Candidatus Moduliflexus flocculans]